MQNVVTRDADFPSEKALEEYLESLPSDARVEYNKLHARNKKLRSEMATMVQAMQEIVAKLVIP